MHLPTDFCYQPVIGIDNKYLTSFHLEDFYASLCNDFTQRVIGYSVNQNPITAISWGHGNVKVLFWSQMHGNESTSTKALVDFLHYLNTNPHNHWKSHFQFMTIPILNPDGAIAYTRENANLADLNRDFIQFSQPESQLLQRVYEEFQPDWCGNLHDQRTIFGVGESDKPATISFLAPSYNESKEYNETRLKAVQVIVVMNQALQKYLPGQIARFDDGFNPNCAGDHFQYLGTPTILFEAGFYPNDLHRNITRKYLFLAYHTMFYTLYENDLVDNKLEDYLKIPQNKVSFYDFICKKVKINYDNSEFITNFAAQYREVVHDGQVQLVSEVVAIGNVENRYAHTAINAQGKPIVFASQAPLEIGLNNSFELENGIKIQNGLII